MLIRDARRARAAWVLASWALFLICIVSIGAIQELPLLRRLIGDGFEVGTHYAFVFGLKRGVQIAGANNNDDCFCFDFFSNCRVSGLNPTSIRALIGSGIDRPGVTDGSGLAGSYRAKFNGLINLRWHGDPAGYKNSLNLCSNFDIKGRGPSGIIVRNSEVDWLLVRYGSIYRNKTRRYPRPVSYLSGLGESLVGINQVVGLSSARLHLIQLSLHDGQLLLKEVDRLNRGCGVLDGRICEFFIGLNQVVSLPPRRVHFLQLATENAELPVRIDGDEISKNSYGYGRNSGYQTIVSVKPSDSLAYRSQTILQSKPFACFSVTIGFVVGLWGVGLMASFPRLLGISVGLGGVLLGLWGIVHGFGVLTA
jgi:hypothetical protein